MKATNKVYKTTPEQREASRRWRLENPDRFAELQRAYREGRSASPQAHKLRKRKYPIHWTMTDRQRFVRFGMSPEMFARRLAEQGGCAICKTPAPRGKNAWHVDHDHQTRAIRGILCITCNIAIGMLHDSPERADAAANYLRRYNPLRELI